jgi:phosphinothricin acetyltransferase
MSLAIRSATAADAEGVAEIYNWYIANTVITFEVDPVDPAEMERRMATTLAAHEWLVLERAGEVLGFAYAGRFRERAAYAHATESTIYLRSGLQGQGLGRPLYAELVRRTFARGYRHLVGVIALPNPASVRLHEPGLARPASAHRLQARPLDRRRELAAEARAARSPSRGKEGRAAEERVRPGWSGPACATIRSRGPRRQRAGFIIALTIAHRTARVEAQPNVSRAPSRGLTPRERRVTPPREPEQPAKRARARRGAASGVLPAARRRPSQRSSELAASAHRLPRPSSRTRRAATGPLRHVHAELERAREHADVASQHPARVARPPCGGLVPVTNGAQLSISRTKSQIASTGRRRRRVLGLGTRLPVGASHRNTWRGGRSAIPQPVGSPAFRGGWHRLRRTARRSASVRRRWDAMALLAIVVVVSNAIVPRTIMHRSLSSESVAA